jgi:cobalt-zinc-cadmium efflux system protein
VNVLLEGVPAHLDTGEVRDALLGMSGVSDLHDLHLWSLGGDRPLLTAHLVLDHSRSGRDVLREATDLLRERFDITHVTLQVEPPDFNVVQTLTAAGRDAASAEPVPAGVPLRDATDRT